MNKSNQTWAGAGVFIGVMLGGAVVFFLSSQHLQQVRREHEQAVLQTNRQIEALSQLNLDQQFAIERSRPQVDNSSELAELGLEGVDVKDLWARQLTGEQMARALIALSLNQKLIVACHRLDLEAAVSALREGADVNSRFGEGDTKVFQDPWTLGWPGQGYRWTALIALANSSRYPEPPRRLNYTPEDMEWAQQQQQRIPAEELALHEQRQSAILSVLLSHNCELDLDNGRGVTPLHAAIYARNEAIARLLIRFGADVNTKAQHGIDGTFLDTPLHRAVWSAELTRLLLEKGADRQAKDSNGRTPLDWARDSGSDEVVRLYESR